LKTEIRICGLGGQGVVLAGQILGRAAFYDGKNTVQTQSYGAEARGGMAKSEVIISDGKIGFPAVRRCDALAAMTQETLDKNIRDLKENGTLLVDNGIIQTVPQTKAHVYKLPMTQASEEKIGERMYANIVMLGALIKITGLVSEDPIKRAIEYAVPRRALDLNMKAYVTGKELATSLHRGY